jgi:predicted nucleic acid-binding protein
MNKVLIDTDVLLDFFYDRKPFSNNSAKILALCESKKIEGYVTAVIISNVYYLLKQNASHEKVIEKLIELIKIIDIITIDKETILQALNSNFKDFEDALQNYSAEKKSSIEIIITRNIKDYKNSSLAIMLPETFLKLIKG